MDTEISAGSEQKFRLLAENIPGAVYLCRNDKAFSMLYINDHIEVITGYPSGDFLSGKIEIASLFHPDDREAIFETVNRSIAERKSFQIEYRLRHTSGEWRWIHETGIGLYEDDKLVMLEGFLNDITPQKSSEEKLRKLAEENLQFFNNPVNLNALMNLNGDLVRISPSWEKILGWTEGELKSQRIFHFIHPDDAERAKGELDYVTRSGHINTFENRLVCKDGSYRWLLWALAPDALNNAIYASAIDISARKKSEENILDSKSNLEGITLQLQEQNRRLDEFAHIISHNLRSPISNIQALINLLNDSSDINDYKLIFDKLKNVAKNLGETMNELMDTLKVKTQLHMDLTEVRFKEVLDKVVQSFEGELILAHASVTFDFNDAPAIRYSKPYLESIFQNLLTNAVKYRSPNRKPTIHFRTSMQEDRVQLQVTDNGQGIDLGKFGDKLFGLHKTFHEHQEARGVGLFLVKTQIEALGGKISAQSEVDKGTTFTITFALPPHKPSPER
ncbi:MAG: PAS domain-containing protein [Bacteroidota bacterium]|nr:PAS domain-containing protein [Bacteroidota bacterium]